MENLKSKEEYRTTVTRPFITAEDLKVSWCRIWNLIKCASGF